MEDIKEESKSMNDVVTEKINMSVSSLLGSYNADNEYVISDIILDELFKIKKVKRNAYNNLLFCSSTLKNWGTLVFEISFSKNDEKKIASATLSLLETINKVNGYVQDTVKTEIGNYTDELNNQFVEKVFEYFNITTEESLVKDPTLENVDITNSFIEAKILLEQELTLFAKEGNEELYETYFNSRYNLLVAQNTEFSLAVLKQFESEYNKIKEFFLKGENKNYKSLSELLDKAIQDVKGTNKAYKKGEEMYIEAVRPIMDTLTKSAEVLHEKILEDAMVKASQENKTKEVKTLVDKKQTESKKSNGESLYKKDKSKAVNIKLGKAPNNKYSYKPDKIQLNQSNLEKPKFSPLNKDEFGNIERKNPKNTENRIEGSNGKNRDNFREILSQVKENEKTNSVRDALENKENNIGQNVRDEFERNLDVSRR